MHNKSIGHSATNWALRLSVAITFGVTGIDKFSAAEAHWLRVFATIGLGQWFRYFTGIVELVGGLLFLVPQATVVGAALLVAAMIGAMTVHIVVFGHPTDSIFPGAYLLGVVVAFVKLRRTQGTTGPSARALSHRHAAIAPTTASQETRCKLGARRIKRNT